MTNITRVTTSPSSETTACATVVSDYKVTPLGGVIKNYNSQANDRDRQEHV